MTPPSTTSEPATVWGAIHAQAERSPDAVAIRTAAGTWSYGRFCDAAERVASGLIGLGIGRGDRVLLFATNSAEACVAWLACQRLGDRLPRRPEGHGEGGRQRRPQARATGHRR